MAASVTASPVIITSMAATESTIPPDAADAVATEDMVEPGTRTKTSLPQILVALLVLGISAFLVWMSWPRLQASFLYLPVDTAIKRYYDQGSIDVAQLSGKLEHYGERCGR